MMASNFVKQYNFQKCMYVVHVPWTASKHASPSVHVKHADSKRRPDWLCGKLLPIAGSILAQLLNGNTLSSRWLLNGSQKQQVGSFHRAAGADPERFANDGRQTIDKNCELMTGAFSKCLRATWLVKADLLHISLNIIYSSHLINQPTASQLVFYA